VQGHPFLERRLPGLAALREAPEELAEGVGGEAVAAQLVEALALEHEALFPAGGVGELGLEALEHGHGLLAIALAVGLGREVPPEVGRDGVVGEHLCRLQKIRVVPRTHPVRGEQERGHLGLAGVVRKLREELPVQGDGGLVLLAVVVELGLEEQGFPPILQAALGHLAVVLHRFLGASGLIVDEAELEPGVRGVDRVREARHQALEALRRGLPVSRPLEGESPVVESHGPVRVPGIGAGEGFVSLGGLAEAAQSVQEVSPG
jgi:hypothetical protein